MDKRTEYVERLSAQMTEWDVQLDLLKDKAKSSTSEAKNEYSNAIEALQLKRDEAAAKLQGIATAGDHEWKELASGTDRVWEEVSTMLHDTIVKITWAGQVDYSLYEPTVFGFPEGNGITDRPYHKSQ
jgi:hypothetical protein